MCFFGILIQPWRFLTQATTFITVISSFGGTILLEMFLKDIANDQLRDLPDDPDPRFFGHHLWGKILKAYSRSLLTYGDDKLVALSGIAKRQQDAMSDEYIAGMWRKWLPSQLLWSVANCRKIDNNPSVRPEKYRSLAWFWASVDGIIRPGGFADDRFLIGIVEVSVHPATSDPTGLVDGGSLRIRGVPKEFNLTP
jgi:hypothetical protein